MKYAFLLTGDAAAEPEAHAFESLCRRLRADGSFRGARRLKPADQARTVRAREGGAAVSDGPTNDGANQVAGFIIAELADERQAAELACDIAEATAAAVELRQVAAPGQGGPDAALEGVQDGTPDGNPEFAFLMNVRDEKRPWPGTAAFDDLMERCGRVLHTLQSRDAFRGTERLVPSAAAKTVRAEAGKRTVLDGPFTEARELIGGFILGECAGMDEAVALAALLPGASSGSVEVREVVSI